MKKKLLSTLLTICVLAGAFASPAAVMDVKAEESAAEAEISGDFEYKELWNGSIGITKYNGNDTDVVIPAEINGKSVTSVEANAFDSCGLQSITIPKGVTNIGEWAFRGCYRLESITIPESVADIGGHAFENCFSLTSVSLPESLTIINDHLFAACGSLKSITIPDSVTTIGNYAFVSCQNLRSVTLSDNLTTMGTYVFFDCGSLESITIPNGVTAIREGLFNSCGYLKSIIIPDSVTSIEKFVFNGCVCLENIKLPKNITYMKEEGTFLDCKSLESIAIPDGVTTIGYKMFWECTNLSSITLPKSVTRIDKAAFSGCSSLNDVYYNGTREQWMAISIENNQNSELFRAALHCTDGDFIITNSETTAINANQVQLASVNTTYNGKSQTPAVTVKDNLGTVISNANYTVRYANNVNVGQASVTVTFQGGYSGTVTKTFNIVPKGTKISKVTPKKKGFTVKWKKQAIQTSGYEIQYSASSKFKGAKTAGNIKVKKTSKTVSKLKAKKKYYIRIRTYKSVSGKKYYSDWSAKKSIKTKK